jgi:hypothetical protein
VLERNPPADDRVIAELGLGERPPQHVVHPP